MARNKTAKSSQSLRIIGGEWRGRKLSFTPIEGLRPTLDRYRETLFNWLMFATEGARCLDLFAGSGALGLEALSRGARQVTFVDQSPQAVRQIDQHLKTLQCKRGNVVCDNALNWLASQQAQFDLVFLDPPFHQDLLLTALDKLFAGGYINDNGYIYIEAESQFQLPPLPPQWQLHRNKSAKNKVFFLIRKNPHS